MPKYIQAFIPDNGNPGQVLRRAADGTFEWADAAGGSTPSFPVTISLQSGVGFVGSVLVSTAAGQWTRDGVNIAGATGTTYTVVQADVGAALRCGNSNTFQLWTPVHLPAAFKTDGTNYGGWFDFGDAATVTLNAGNVAAISNKFSGGPSLAQASAAAQLPYSGGAMQSSGAGGRGVRPASNILAAHAAMVMQYRTGTESFASEYAGVLSIDSDRQRVHLTASGRGLWLPPTPLFDGCIRNGISTAVVLPFQKGMIEFVLGSAIPALWSPGYAVAGSDFSWVGPIFEVLFLAAAPTRSTLDKIQGYLMWNNGVASRLPLDHVHFSAPPKGPSHT